MDWEGFACVADLIGTVLFEGSTTLDMHAAIMEDARNGRLHSANAEPF